MHGHILSRRSAFAKNSILEEERIVESLKKKGRKVVELNRGDPPVYFPTPKYIIDAYVNALHANHTGYSRAEGVFELVDAIQRRYSRMYNIAVHEHDVIVTAGITEGLSFLNAALINEGDMAVIFSPYYNQYMSQLRMDGGIPILERYDESNGWNIDTESVRRSLSRLKVQKRLHKVKYMIITNPNNPTGTVLKRSVLEEIADIANDNGVLLVSDEIYDEIVYNGARFTTMSRIAKGMPHVILNGASKDYDATGFRIGYMIVPERDRMSVQLKDKLADLARVRLSVNTPAQYAVAEAMNNAKKHNRALRNMVSSIEHSVNYATKRINDNPYLSVVRPNGAFYILPRVDFSSLKLKDDHEFVDKLLKSEGVQLTRGSGFGASSHIRIVALPPKEILGYAMDKIDDFCARNARKR